MFSQRGAAKRDRGQLFDLRRLGLETRSENENAIRRLCSAVYLGDRTVLCRVLGRFKMFVDANDAGLSPHLMLDGYWEMWLTEAVMAYVKPGMTCVDIGANLGYFTVLMAACAGPHGRVDAFEPNTRCATLLRQSCDVNGFRSIVNLHRTPLMDSDGSAVRLIVPDGEPKNGHIVRAEASDPESIVARRFDSYPDLLAADIVKIDAEGAEEAIWSGMRGLFARQGKPLTIFLEFAAARYQDPASFVDKIIAERFSLNLLSLDQGILPLTREQLLAAPPREDQLLVLSRAA